MSSGKRSKNCMFSIDFNGILNKMAAPKSAKRDVRAITFQLKYFSLYGKGPLISSEHSPSSILIDNILSTV